MTERTDRELLELAVKAAGVAGKWGREGYIERREGFIPTGHRAAWNPLEDDGDALRLAVKLNLALLFPMRNDAAPQVGAGQVGALTAAKMEPVTPDKYAATRRAIVRAAAEIGAKP